jgi:uncharacterized protein (TIGR02996 family)
MNEARLADQLREILRRIPGMLVVPEIPHKKLVNARAACGIPDGETVIGLYDLTLFGSATKAAVFTTRALYIRDRWTSERAGELVLVEYGELLYERVGDNVRIGVAGIATHVRDLAKIGGAIEAVAGVVQRERARPQEAVRTPGRPMERVLAPAPVVEIEADEPDDLADDPTALDLQAAIAAAPDDEAPRLVLADLLLSAEDPRGELLVLDTREREEPEGLTDPDQLEHYLLLAAVYSFPNPHAEEPTLPFTQLGRTRYSILWAGCTYEIRFSDGQLEVFEDAERALSCRLQLASPAAWTADETTVILRIISDAIRAGSPLRSLRFPFMFDPLPIYDGGPLRCYRLPKDYTGPRGLAPGQLGLAARDYNRWMAIWMRLARMLKAERKRAAVLT